MPDIESLLKEKRVFKPAPEFTRQANWNKKTIDEKTIRTTRRAEGQRVF